MKKIVMICLLLLITGCSSQISNKIYYQLSSDFSNNNLQLKKVNDLIFIDAVSVANYLNQNGIIYQTDVLEYNTASNNLWLTTLSNQLQQRLVTDLSALLPHHFITTEPLANPNMKIKLFIDAFHGSYTGDALIKGRWVITDSNNNITTKNIDAKLRLSADGYGALVKTLSKGWQEEEFDLVRSVKWP